MDLHALKRMEELKARRRICGHVVMLLCQKGGEAKVEGLVCVAGCQVAVVLFVGVWVGDVSGFVAELGEEGVVLACEVGTKCACEAPAGGAAAAAPEGGALPGQSAPTSTSTRWTLVTM
jgi:hypothetical protein